MTLRKQLFAVKGVDLLMAEMAGEHGLRRVLGPVSLTALGVGAIIGAGIFVLTGLAANVYAGPALAVSFIVAGLGCTFAAPTRTRTRRWVSSSRGSSAGT
jgi:APA family basic amino acid/polyamine antiporter